MTSDIQQLRDVVSELAFGEPQIEDHTELLISGILDSLAVTQVAVVMEDCLKMEVPPLDMIIENFESIQAMEKYMQSRRS